MVPPVVAGGAAAMLNARVAVPVPALLVALRLTVTGPAVVGVPEINPVAVLIDNPEGSPVAE